MKGDESPADWFLNRYDKNGDNQVKKTEMLSIVDRGPGLDRLWLLRDPRARANNALRQFDQDKNGTVALSEYPGDKNTFTSMGSSSPDTAWTLASLSVYIWFSVRSKGIG